MYHLKLIKGMSYTVGNLSASKRKPDLYVEDKEQADKLVKTGFFTVVGETAEQNASLEENEGELEADTSEESESGETPLIAELQGKNKADLVAYAGQNGIDITGCKTKDDILQRIIEAIARADAAREALRSE
ncbi:MAG: hypothetical protein LIO94_04755 [Clostridiales bacterium]|nr:hypothetical protein [Clostridiales bacterium]